MSRRDICKNRMRSVVLLAALLPLTAKPEDRWLNEHEKMFVLALQYAVRTDDTQWFAEHSSFPLDLEIGQRHIAVQNQAALIELALQIFIPDYRRVMLAQTLDKGYFEGKNFVVGYGSTKINCAVRSASECRIIALRIP